jgi:hypothetical protein
MLYPRGKLKKIQEIVVIFLKGIISTAATDGITCLGLFKNRYVAGVVSNDEELLSTDSNLSDSAD